MCNERLCDDRCSLHGQCNNGTCTCLPGWNGRHCTLGTFVPLIDYYFDTCSRNDVSFIVYYFGIPPSSAERNRERRIINTVIRLLSTVLGM